MTNTPDLKKRSVKSFLVFFLMIFCLFALWGWASHRSEDDDIAPVLRSFHEMNGKVWQYFYQPDRLAPEFPTRPAGAKARINGDIGLTSPIDLSKWVLDVTANADAPETTHITITMDELRALPRVESTIEFKCIEGWSEVISYAGVRFSDFLKHYKLGSHLSNAWEDGKLPAQRFLYVGLETPDGEYYVSNDMESMLHPQTLLVYEMNGEPLTFAHGAPLRLLIPVKYGIKSLKRIGRIFFSDQRPPDYWAERGYDWFSGL